MRPENTNKHKHPKATKEEQRRQTIQVMEWLTLGWSRQKICSEGCRLWGYDCDRVIDARIKQARKEFKEAWNNTDRQQFVAQQLSRLDLVVEKSFEQKQLAVTHASILAQCKLLGVGDGSKF